MDPRTVLIVDDERHITSIMKRRLEEAGFIVFEARNGVEALDLAPKVRPHAVVTDLQMPRISGLELAVALTQLPVTRATPVIMLTGRSHYVSQSALAKTNIRQIIEKPFSARQVVAAVEALLTESDREAA